MASPSCILDTALSLPPPNGHAYPSSGPAVRSARLRDATRDSRSAQGSPVTPLRAIRLAMMGGVLLFGAVSWFLTALPDWSPPEPGLVDRLGLVARITWFIAVGALLVLFLKYRQLESPAQASTFAILAWALGETLALLGGVVYFLTSLAAWYIAGVIALVVTFLAFPPPDPVRR